MRELLMIAVGSALVAHRFIKSTFRFYIVCLAKFHIF